MKTKLDTELISHISNTYITIFLGSIKESLGKRFDHHAFLNALLGFVYAAKKLLNSMQVLGMLTPDQIVKIDKQLLLAAERDVPKDKIIEILKEHLVSKEENNE